MASQEEREKARERAQHLGPSAHIASLEVQLAQALQAAIKAENWLTCHGANGAGADDEPGLVSLLGILRAVPGVPDSSQDGEPQ